MGKKISLLLAFAIVGMLLVPALASAALVNEYGMHYAGQQTCLNCHGGILGPSELALHGRFAQSGILPAVPEGWTAFQGPGDLAKAHTIDECVPVADLVDHAAAVALMLLRWGGGSLRAVTP